MAISVQAQMLHRLKESEARFLRITEELGVPHIIADRKKFSELSKELTIYSFENRMKIRDNICDA